MCDYTIETGRVCLLIAVLGFFGGFNTGDELILQAVLGDLRAVWPMARLRVLSSDPAATASRHGVEAVPRRPSGAALAGVDLLVVGGGGLFQNENPRKVLRGPIGLYGTWVALARRKRIPVVMYAQGVGPLNGALARQLTKRAMRAATAITVRDEASRALLLGLAPALPVHCTADAAFSLPLSDGPSGQKGLLCLRPWPGMDRVLAGVRPLLAQELPFDAIVLEARDLEPMRRALPEVDWEFVGEAGDLLRRAAAARVVVAMRLHALIAGALAGRPLVGIAYDPKVTAMLAGIGLPEQAIPMSTQGLLEAYRAALQEDMPARVAAASRMLARRAAENRRILKEALP